MHTKVSILILVLVASLLISLDTRAAFAQQGQQVSNGDGGRAYIIGREPEPATDLPPRVPATAEPMQYSIFLGSGWTSHSNLRGREPELASLLANIGDSQTKTNLAERGIKNYYGPTFSREQLALPGETTISDLDIERMLAELLREKTLPRSSASTIYVVFLAPELESTLGSMIGGKHFAAYHSFFNSGGSKLHYVVMPFESDRATAVEIARRAFIAAALTPEESNSN